MKLIITPLLTSILLESTMTTLPSTLLIIVFAAVSTRKNDIFILAFLAGLLLDILRLGTIGLSSVYFVTMVMIIFAYQKKLEIDSLNFITLTSAIGSFGYLFLIGTTHIISQALIAALFAAVSFFVFKKMGRAAWKK